MSEENFNTLYKRLNKAQREAVDTVEGPVMVVAGPGTGKTSILTLRIANILRQTDTNPENILALTFTESGVYSMRKKLVDIIGSLAYRVNIYTFHSFCNDIIKSNPEEFPEIIGRTNISDIDQIKIIENILDQSNFKKIKFYGDNAFYVKPIIASIQNLKREGVSPKELKFLIKKTDKDFYNIDDLYHKKGSYKGVMKGPYKSLEKKLQRNQELLIVYEKYEEALRNNKFYDYEDMIMKTIGVLSLNKNLLLELQERYQYFLVDEHQDTNNAQNKLLELLNNFHKNPNLFIVGDEKQAIFRFQGASLENFLYFKGLFPKALLVNLNQNYRSTKPILDASHSLALKNKSSSEGFLREKLQSNVSFKEQKIKLLSFSNPDYEHIFLAYDIEAKIKAGFNPGSIAILYRDNKDAIPLAKILEKTKIPFIIESNQDVLADDEINKLLLIFRSINNLSNENLLAKVLHIDIWDLDSLDIFKVLSFSKENNKKISDILKNKTDLIMAKVAQPERILDLYSKLEKWSRLGHNINFIDTFEAVLNESGFIKHLLKNSASVEKMNKLENLFSEVRKISLGHQSFKLTDFIEYLNILINYNILIKMKEGVSLIDSIHLMTAHKSKGLEFDYVYVIGANDGHWGNRRSVKHFYIPNIDGTFSSGSEPYENEDERRLFYVALTRAKKEVILTYSRENFDKDYKIASQFVEEIDKEYIDEIDTKEIEKKLSLGINKYSPKINKSISIKNKEYLRNLFLDQGFSVTAINNYIGDPWDYFFISLVRIPGMPSTAQEYGTAMHQSLSLKNPTKKKILDAFKKNLSKKTLNRGDYEKYLKRGQDALSGYYKMYSKSLRASGLNEIDIAGVFTEVLWQKPIKGSQTQKINILLKGKIDRLEFLDNGKIRIIDYKTGAPKSRNWIEGKTKNSNGNYKRQLVFYKLLLKKLETQSTRHSDILKNVRMSGMEGVIDFIEPNEKGEHKREIFNITDEEVMELEKEIQKIALEILNFKFWKVKPKQNSKYRDLVEMLK